MTIAILILQALADAAARSIDAHPLLWIAGAIAIVTLMRSSVHMAEARGWRATAWLMIAVCVMAGCVVSVPHSVTRAEASSERLGDGPR